MDYISKLGVQSWCYRDYKSIPELIGAVKETGLSRLELCGVHLDFGKSELYAPTLKAFADAGVKIVSTGVNGLGADEAKVRPLFDFAEAAGLRQFSVGFDMKTFDAQLAVAEKLAEEYGVMLTVHNHGGYCWYGSVDALRYIFGKSSKRVGLMLDLAWAMQTGTSVYDYIKAFGDRLGGVHLKDFSFDRAGHWKDEVVGSGNLNLKDLKKALEDVGFDGEPIIEYEGDAANPIPALKQCVQALREAWA